MRESAQMVRALFLFVLTGFGLLQAQDEYFCYMPKTDTYLFSYPNEKDECAAEGGKFGRYPRDKFKWFCNLGDSGFMIGKKPDKAKASELCGSGQLQKPK